VVVAEVAVVPADKEDATREMADNCPASAIEVED
jgi:ferredoxin